MENSPHRKKGRDLNKEEFDKLLAALGGGEEYQRLRLKLIRFLEWQGCLHPEACADETLNRLARKISEEVIITDINNYARGVARLVAKEDRRKYQREEELRDYPEPQSLDSDEDPSHSLRVDCFRSCLNKLSPENRDDLIRYYEDEKNVRIRNRAELAKLKGRGPNALRISMHRLRKKIAQCTNDCMQLGQEIESYS